MSLSMEQGEEMKDCDNDVETKVTTTKAVKPINTYSKPGSSWLFGEKKDVKPAADVTAADELAEKLPSHISVSDYFKQPAVKAKEPEKVKEVEKAKEPRKSSFRLPTYTFRDYSEKKKPLDRSAPTSPDGTTVTKTVKPIDTNSNSGSSWLFGGKTKKVEEPIMIKRDPNAPPRVIGERPVEVIVEVRKPEKAPVEGRKSSFRLPTYTFRDYSEKKRSSSMCSQSSVTEHTLVPESVEKHKESAVVPHHTTEHVEPAPVVVQKPVVEHVAPIVTPHTIEAMHPTIVNPPVEASETEAAIESEAVPTPLEETGPVPTQGPSAKKKYRIPTYRGERQSEPRPNYIVIAGERVRVLFRRQETKPEKFKEGEKPYVYVWGDKLKVFCFVPTDPNAEKKPLKPLKVDWRSLTKPRVPTEKEIKNRMRISPEVFTHRYWVQRGRFRKKKPEVFLPGEKPFVYRVGDRMLGRKWEPAAVREGDGSPPVIENLYAYMMGRKVMICFKKREPPVQLEPVEGVPITHDGKVRRESVGKRITLFFTNPEKRDPETSRLKHANLEVARPVRKEKKVLLGSDSAFAPRIRVRAPSNGSLVDGDHLHKDLKHIIPMQEVPRGKAVLVPDAAETPPVMKPARSNKHIHTYKNRLNKPSADGESPRSWFPYFNCFRDLYNYRPGKAACDAKQAELDRKKAAELQAALDLRQVSLEKNMKEVNEGHASEESEGSEIIEEEYKTEEDHIRGRSKTIGMASETSRAIPLSVGAEIKHTDTVLYPVVAAETNPSIAALLFPEVPSTPILPIAPTTPIIIATEPQETAKVLVSTASIAVSIVKVAPLSEKIKTAPADTVFLANVIDESFVAPKAKIAAAAASAPTASTSAKSVVSEVKVVPVMSELVLTPLIETRKMSVPAIVSHIEEIKPSEPTAHADVSKVLVPSIVSNLEVHKPTEIITHPDVPKIVVPLAVSRIEVPKPLVEAPYIGYLKPAVIDPIPVVEPVVPLEDPDTLSASNRVKVLILTNEMKIKEKASDEIERKQREEIAKQNKLENERRSSSGESELKAYLERVKDITLEAPHNSSSANLVAQQIPTPTTPIVLERKQSIVAERKLFLEGNKHTAETIGPSPSKTVNAVPKFGLGASKAVPITLVVSDVETVEAPVKLKAASAHIVTPVVSVVAAAPAGEKIVLESFPAVVVEDIRVMPRAMASKPASAPVAATVAAPVVKIVTTAVTIPATPEVKVAAPVAPIVAAPTPVAPIVAAPAHIVPTPMKRLVGPPTVPVATPEPVAPIIAAPIIAAPIVVIAAPIIAAPIITAPIVVTPTPPAPFITAPIVVTPTPAAPIIAAPIITAPIVVTPTPPAPIIAAPIIAAPIITAPIVVTPTPPAPIIAAPIITAPIVVTPTPPAPIIAAPIIAAPIITAPIVVTPTPPAPIIAAPIIAAPIVVTPTPAVPDVAVPAPLTSIIAAPVIVAPKPVVPIVDVPEPIAPVASAPSTPAPVRRLVGPPIVPTVSPVQESRIPPPVIRRSLPKLEMTDKIVRGKFSDMSPTAKGANSDRSAMRSDTVNDDEKKRLQDEKEEEEQAARRDDEEKKWNLEKDRRAHIENTKRQFLENERLIQAEIEAKARAHEEKKAASELIRKAKAEKLRLLNDENEKNWQADIERRLREEAIVRQRDEEARKQREEAYRETERKTRLEYERLQKEAGEGSPFFDSDKKKIERRVLQEAKKKQFQENERKIQIEIDKKMRLTDGRKALDETDRRARQQKFQRASDDNERNYQEEIERNLKAQIDSKIKEENEKRKREELYKENERKLKNEHDRKIRELAQFSLAQENERRLRVEIERKRNEEHQKRMAYENEKTKTDLNIRTKRADFERKIKDKIVRHEDHDHEVRVKIEVEDKQREDSEMKGNLERRRLQALELERRKNEQIERRLKDENARQLKIEKERMVRDEKAARVKQEYERSAREEADRKLKMIEERKVKDETEKKKRHTAEKAARESFNGVPDRTSHSRKWAL